MAVSPKPSGYHDVTPYLIVDGAADAIAFYVQAFGARERMRMPRPGGRIGHAELQIGDSVVMLADEFPDAPIQGPRSRGGTTVSFLVYVPDVDAEHQRAVEAGAKVVRPLADPFHGGTARSRSRTPSVTRGRSPRTSRTWTRRSSSAASRR